MAYSVEKTFPVAWLDEKLLQLYCHDRGLKLQHSAQNDHNHRERVSSSTHEARGGITRYDDKSLQIFSIEPREALFNSYIVKYYVRVKKYTGAFYLFIYDK